MLEDSPVDAELAQRELRRGGIDFDCHRVEGASSFEQELRSFDPQIILAEYDPLGFDGFTALRFRNEQRRDTPFIFLSGTLGAALAVEAVRAGATDCVAKERLSDLVPAVERALREYGERPGRTGGRAALVYRAGFQQLIAGLSTRFANVWGAALDEELERALEAIGSFAGADRSFLFLCSDDGKYLRSLEWCADGVEPLPEDRRLLPFSGSPWMLSPLRSGEHDLLAALQNGAVGRESLPFGEPASFVSVPMMIAGKLLGFVGFSPLREGAGDEGDHADEALLQTVGEILAGAILRRRSEKALRDERDFVTRILETTTCLIMVLDTSGHFVRVNPAFEKATGYTVEDLEDRQFWHLGPPESEERARAAFSLALHQPLEGHHDSLLTREGDERRIVWHTSPIVSRELGFVVATGIDLTERHRSEEERERLKAQLEQQTRLDGLGRLAATVTHEFNNVLMGIKPFTRVLQKRWPEDPGIAEVANQIAKAVLRGERITREILRYTRPAEATLNMLDLKSWLSGFVQEMREQLNERFELRLELPEGLAMIDADPTPLHQALNNLVLNAREAMPNGGTIFISLLQNITAGLDAEDRSLLQLTVRDTGRGIPAEILSHVFEPLFTTKKSGTGLGLAVTNQIIAAHGGYILAESEVGEGSSFHLFFPDPAQRHGKLAAEAPVEEMRTDRSVG